MLVLIRTETAADHHRITEIHLEAFRNHPFSNRTEHLIVEGLREAGALTLSLVAEADGVVLGHVAFSPVTIAGLIADGLLRADGVDQRLSDDCSGLKDWSAALRELGANGCVLVRSGLL